MLCAVDLLEWHRKTNDLRPGVGLCTDETSARVCGMTSCSLLTQKPCSAHEPPPWAGAQLGGLDFVIRTVEGFAVVHGGNVKETLHARPIDDPSTDIALALPSRPTGLITDSYSFASRTVIVISTDHGSVVVSVESLAAPPRLVAECPGRAIIRQDLGTVECLSPKEEETGVWSRDHLGPFTIELRRPGGGRGALWAIDRHEHAVPIVLPPAAFPGKGIEANWSADQLARGGGRLFVFATAGWVSDPVIRQDAAVYELVPAETATCPAADTRCVACDPGYQSTPPKMNWDADVEELP